jgi:hypothetical protein
LASPIACRTSRAAGASRLTTRFIDRFINPAIPCLPDHLPHEGDLAPGLLTLTIVRIRDPLQDLVAQSHPVPRVAVPEEMVGTEVRLAASVVAEAQAQSEAQR